MKAVLLFRDKFIDKEGDLLQWVVWEIPKSRFYREGVRYRFVFVPKEKKQPAVLYDNHHPKGHHKHLEDFEQPYLFLNIDQLLIDFKKDVQIWKSLRGTNL